jgi:outer membrane protein assembly factor BamA
MPASRRKWLAASLGLSLLLAALPAAAQDPGAPAPATGQASQGTQDRWPGPRRVDKIRVLGLIRTQEYVVRRELGFREGDVITQEMFDLAITRLWNTTIFARVQGHLEDEQGQTVCVLELEDRWTLNPLIGYGAGGSAFFFRLGAADNNILGRFLEVQAQYQYFDGFHGGQIIVRDPRLLDERMELLVQAERLVRPRPGFSDQRTQIISEIAKQHWQDRMRFGFRVNAFMDRFLSPLDPPERFPAPTETLLLSPTFRIGRVDTVRLRQTGASLEVRPGLGLTTSDVTSQYVQMIGEAMGFAMVGERLNLAMRVRAGTVSRVPEHLQLYVGGLDLLRGFRDNHLRTNVYALENAEVRFVAFDSTWVALMPTVFADAVVSRNQVGVPRFDASAGAGLRVLVPKFVGTGLRADFATPLTQAASFEVNLGVYQFFDASSVAKIESF